MDSSNLDEDSDLEDIIEKPEVVWTITYPKKPISNSSQRIRKLWNDAQKHESNFHGKGQAKEALNLRYIVEPSASGPWLGMQNYSKCTSK